MIRPRDVEEVELEIIDLTWEFRKMDKSMATLTFMTYVDGHKVVSLIEMRNRE